MDSNKLRYFLIVTETGSIRKAAEILRLSPAALSKSIKLLERETGLRLLIPAGRGIAITKEGANLAKNARPVLENLDTLASRIVNEKESEKHQIRIGSFEVFTTHFLKPLLRVFEPESNLLLRELIPGEMETALLRGEIDLGITYIPIPTAGIEHIRVAAVKMGIYAKRGCFANSSLSEIPFAIPVQPLKGTPNKVQGLDGWPDGKISRNIRYHVTLMESALELCRNGIAAAYLPSFVAHLHNESVQENLRLSRLPTPKGLAASTQAVYISRRKDDPEDQRTRRLARVLRETCLKG